MNTRLFSLLVSTLALAACGQPRPGHGVVVTAEGATTSAPPSAPRGPLTGPLPPAPLKVGIEEHLGRQIPLDLVFRDQDGKPFRLGDHLNHGRPLVLELAYYRCPMLCDLVMGSLAHAMTSIGWVPGKQVDFLTVSIDPKDTPAVARLKQGHVLQAMNHPEATAGWPFLVGTEKNARKLADAIGFQYVYDPTSGQYAHAAGAVVLTPQGRIARYVYGVAFRPFDLRLALTEASGGKVGGFTERVLLTCFRYDPSARRYGIYVVGVLKGGGLLVLLTVAICLLVLWRRDISLRAKAHLQPDLPPDPDPPPEPTLSSVPDLPPEAPLPQEEHG